MKTSVIPGICLSAILTAAAPAAAQTVPITFEEFGPSAVLLDFESAPVVGLEGATIGNVTFNTLNGDSGSFLVEPAFGSFVTHSPTKMALKGDGWDGESNWPPPSVGATFAAPVRAVGAWISTPGGVIVRVQNAQFQDLATFSLGPNSGSTAFVGFASTTPIKRFVIEGQSIAGIGFDDLIYEPLPYCDLQLSHASGNLTLQFDLMLEAPATWNVWINATNDAYRLWSVQVPAADYPPFPVTLPVSGYGRVGVLTTLARAGTGVVCSTWKTIDTGPPAAAAQPGSPRN